MGLFVGLTLWLSPDAVIRENVSTQRLGNTEVVVHKSEKVKSTITTMPGYDSDVIMAAGAFVQGSSIELSADGPTRPPYAVYFQGGLTWYHAKLGILMSLQKMLEAGLISL